MGAISEGLDAVSVIYDMIKEGQEAKSKSLPQRARSASAISRVYIDSELADEDIMLPLIGALNQLYVAYIITVLGLESFVARGKKMRDITKVVSSESLIDDAASIEAAFDNAFSSIESKIGDAAGDVLRQKMQDRNKSYRTEEQQRASSPKSGAKTVQLTDKEQQLITGRLIELEIATETGGSTPIRIFSQLIPRIIDPVVSAGFLTSNMPVKFSRRLRQLQSGEIKFWKDFVFALDRLKHIEKAFKEDATGEFAAMMAQKNNALTKWWLSLSQLDRNYNAASAVMIIDRHTFEKALQDSGTSFDSRGQSKFFASSMMMHLVVVDRDYNEVDIYTHGIRDHGTYSFGAIEKVGASKSSGMDLKDVMTVFGRGASPRI